MKYSFSDILKLSRPRFWLYLGGTYIVGYTAAMQSINQYASPSFFVNLLFFLLIANIFLYGVNDYFDEDTDQYNEKKGDKELLLQSSQKVELKKILLIVSMLSLLTVIVQQLLITKLFFLLFLLLSYFYSAPPLRFKAKPIVDFLSNALYILPGIIGYVQITKTFPHPLIISATLCWAFAMHLFSAIPDIEPDKQAELKTSAVLLGKNKSLLLCVIFWSIFSGILITKKILFPLSIGSLIYPIIPLVILLKPSVNIHKIYWLYPYINGLTGFLTYLWIIGGK